MTSSFGEVLDREACELSAVTDAATLAEWRCRLVEEVLTPRSRYAQALRSAGDRYDRAAFLERWRDLIAAAVSRVLSAGSPRLGSTAAEEGPEIDAQQTAVTILAALHGGTVLSRVAREPAALQAALDLALAPLMAAAGAEPPERGSSGLSGPQISMDS